jgi:uncharacterized protein (DUF1810 family)
MNDAYNLQRYVAAQESIYTSVLAEFGHEQKRSHWMWFIFSQVEGLGASAMVKRFAISSLDEAKAYLKHTVLGDRLREVTALVNRIEGRSIEDVFGYRDYLKFQSSMCLFAVATSHNEVFLEALDKYFDGESDTRTMQRLKLR